MESNTENKKTAYLVVTVCLMLLALLCLFGPFSRNSPVWYKVVALAAVTVTTLPLSVRGETEKKYGANKFGIVQVVCFVLLLMSVFVYLSVLSGKPAEKESNEYAAAFTKLIADGVFLWGGFLGMYLMMIASEAVKKGRKSGSLMMIGVAVSALCLALMLLPAFAEKGDFARQLMGVPYLLTAGGFFLLSRMEAYGHI